LGFAAHHNRKKELGRMKKYGYYIVPGDLIPDGLDQVPVVIFVAEDFSAFEK